jgi:class I fructose-bisphosphate aldolase
MRVLIVGGGRVGRSLAERLEARGENVVLIENDRAVLEDLRNDGFKVDGTDYHTSADLTGQANHLGVTIEADMIKQKMPTNNGGYNAIKAGKTDKKVYDELTPDDHPIELTRYQMANCYLGRSPLINSGGASSGASDKADAVKTAVINKRAGGIGLISGRKAFQRSMEEGVELLHAIQDVYLDDSVTVA